nr:hypothetical protein [Corticibacter populi]
MQAHQLQGLGWFEMGVLCITTRNRPVRVPEDVCGLKIRIPPNPSHILAFRLLEANPKPRPYGGPHHALEGDTVDSRNTRSPPHGRAVSRGPEAPDTQPPCLRGHADHVVMNHKRFAALAPELQQILPQTARSLLLPARTRQPERGGRERQMGVMRMWLIACEVVVMDRQGR